MNNKVGTYQDEIVKRNQRHDILLEFRCPDRWLVRAAIKPTIVNDTMLAQTKVDPKQNCKYLYKKMQDKVKFDKHGHQLTHNKIRPKKDVKKIFTRFSFTLFSMYVSGSFLASFNVTTFYTTLVLMIGGQIRLIFIYGTWRGFIYEITHPDAIIKVVEACYMFRHEQELYKEEESYRMIVEIVRTPDLLKALSGSTLKGDVDPLLDKFSEADKKKLSHLNKFELKGFEVTKIER